MDKPFQLHDDMAGLFGGKTLERGRRYVEERRVSLRSRGEDDSIRALVHGTGSRPYRVRVRVTFEPEIDVRGTCTCPIGYRCKHIAAAVIAAVHAGEVAAPASPLDEWLREVERPAGPPRSDKKPGRAILFLIEAEDDLLGEPPSVRIVSAQVKKRGGYGGVRDQELGRLERRPPAYVTPEDELLALELRVRENRGWGHTRLEPQLPAGEDGPPLLHRLVQTGRCHYGTEQTPALTWGEPRRARLAWRINRYGEQELAWNIDGVEDPFVVLALRPPHYLERDTGRCGPIAADVEPRVAARALAAPRVPAGEAIDDDDRERLEALGLPVPRTLRVSDEDAQPVPCLALEDEAALLEFDYAGVRVGADDHHNVVGRVVGDTVTRIERNDSAELRHRAELDPWGFVAGMDGRHTLRAPEDWAKFMQSGVPALKKKGWRFEVDPDFRFHIATVDAWYVDVRDAAEEDWFSMALGVEVEGQHINLLPAIIEIIESGRDIGEGEVELRLPDGRRIMVPSDRLYLIMGVLLELHTRRILEDDYGALPLNPLGAVRFAELASLDDVNWIGGERLRVLRDALERATDLLPAPQPAALQGHLRDYQRVGLAWLQHLRAHDLGGILADDMGLGKTIQVLSHLLAERAAGRVRNPSLVVAPTSVLSAWREQAQKFAPSLRVLVLHGPRRREHEIDDYDLVITSYAIVLRDQERLARQPLHLLVLDEANAIKNPQAKITGAVHTLRAEQRLCLTGTPVENNLGELWSLFDFAAPGLLGTRSAFTTVFRTPIERHGDPRRRAQLARRVAPFLLRRTKDEVLSELPPKTEMVRYVQLRGRQLDLYESVRMTMEREVRRAIEQRGLAKSRVKILDALLKLRQACCDPRIVKVRSGPALPAGNSAKLSALIELLEQLLSSGRRVLVFSQFVQMLRLIEAELKERELDYLLLTGSTRDRETPVRRFQAREVPLFLISLKAGGLGLTLTAADAVVHYDPWWNPATETQATDRAHRIGQSNPVFVYKLIAEGTVEQRIASLQERKRQLAASVFEGEATQALPFDTDDLDYLLQPVNA